MAAKAADQHRRIGDGDGNGRAVDASGAVAHDPSVNVIAVINAVAASSAMLRDADIKYNDSQHAHLKEISILRAVNAETLRESDLDRLAKTREVDVTTGAAQASALATAVQTLQTASDRNAEMLRSQLNADRAALAKQVQDTAATLSAQTDSQMKDVNNRIAELQKSQYQGVGKSSVADPMMAEFVSDMRTLIKGQARDGGKSEGGQAMWGYVAFAIGLFITLAGLAIGAVTLILRFGGTP